MSNDIFNPIEYTLQETGMTRRELAEMCDVSQTTVEYLISGSYGTIPGELIGIISEILPHNREYTIQGMYEQWKMNKLMSLKLPRVPKDFPSLWDMMHPHVEWRYTICDMGINEYASALCVPRFVIQKLEAGKQKRFPKQLFMHLNVTMNYADSCRLREACEMKSS